MEAWLEQLTKIFLEGEIKSGALAVGLRALDGVRRLVIVHHFLVVAGLLCGLSFFAMGFGLCSGWAEFQWAAPPPALVFSLGVFVVSGGVLWYSCRSRTWVSAFGLRRQIQAAIQEHTSAPASHPLVDPEALASLISKLIEQKLNPAAQPVAPVVPNVAPPETL